MHRLRPGDRRRGRAGRGLTSWLLVRGRGDRPLDAAVDASRVTAHSASRRPAVAVGERCVLYAAVWQAVFGLAEVAGEPEHDPRRERWAWRFPIRPLLLVADLHDAPAVEEIGVFPQSIWRHSHIRLTAEQVDRATKLIRAARRRGPRHGDDTET